MKFNKTRIAIIILFIFYIVGLLGLYFEFSKEIFLNLTPLNLLLTLGLLIWVNSDHTTDFWIALVIISLTGFFIEVAGVHTGKLFGIYEYGQPLGIKIFQVPLIIGVNWFILSYAARGVMMKLTTKIWLQLVLGALLMVGLDLVIEPVATKLDFWTWENDIIPFQNYLMWFATAIVMQFILSVWAFKINKQMAFALLIIQFFFFGLLNLLL